MAQHKERHFTQTIRLLIMHDTLGVFSVCIAFWQPGHFRVFIHFIPFLQHRQYIYTDPKSQRSHKQVVQYINQSPKKIYL